MKIEELREMYDGKADFVSAIELFKHVDDLIAVAAAAKEVARFLEPEWRDDIERGDADTAMVEALAKLESVK